VAEPPPEPKLTPPAGITAAPVCYNTSTAFECVYAILVGLLSAKSLSIDTTNATSGV
jgi:hypothetical protein